MNASPVSVEGLHALSILWDVSRLIPTKKGTGLRGVQSSPQDLLLEVGHLRLPLNLCSLLLPLLPNDSDLVLHVFDSFTCQSCHQALGQA